MKAMQQDIDERTNLTSTNKFELLLFRLGTDNALNKSELFGINVFKIREIVAMPSITPATPASTKAPKISIPVIHAWLNQGISSLNMACNTA
mgnify:CR=1 FL=1